MFYSIISCFQTKLITTTTKMDLSYVRSSHWKSYVKKDVLKNLRIFTEIYVYWSFFLTKLQAFRPLVGILLSWLLLITFITTKHICVFSSLSYYKLKELKNLSHVFSFFPDFQKLFVQSFIKSFCIRQYKLMFCCLYIQNHFFPR